MNSTKKPISREELYELVWSEPMLRVAARFGVSSSYMARICKVLNVPRPKRGYWAKRSAGKKTSIPELPKAQPWHETVWVRDGQGYPAKVQLPRPPEKNTRRKRENLGAQTDRHQLVDGAKQLFLKGRLSHEVGYLKPAKLLLVDLVVTKSVLDRALDFANHLFLKLEDRGFRVVIAPNSEPFGRASVDEHEVPGGHRWHDNLWSPCRCTVVYVGTVAIGLTIVEISEEAKARYVDGEYVRESDCPPLKAGVAARGDSWTSTKDFPSGRLFLQAYSPYRGTHWVRHWRETNKRDLYKQVKTIIRELERAAVDISVLVEEAQRQAELERQRMKEQLEKWRREEENRKAIQARKDSREELVQIIEAWVHANHVEVFFRDAESQAAKLGEGERQRILERVRLARDLIGSVDALDHFLQWKSPNER